MRDSFQLKPGLDGMFAGLRADAALGLGRKWSGKAFVTGFATAVKTISFQFPLCQRVSPQRAISVKQTDAWLSVGALLTPWMSSWKLS